MQHYIGVSIADREKSVLDKEHYRKERDVILVVYLCSNNQVLKTYKGRTKKRLSI